jgi:hypothetical protein
MVALRRCFGECTSALCKIGLILKASPATSGKEVGIIMLPFPCFSACSFAFVFKGEEFYRDVLNVGMEICIREPYCSFG